MEEIQKRIATFMARHSRAEQPDALCMFGSQLLADGDLDDAMACFDRALQLSAQGCAKAWVGRGEVLARKNRAGEALGCVERALVRDPELVAALIVKADILLKVGSRKEALDCYDSAVASTPDNAHLWINRARLLEDLEREAEALTSLDRALALEDSPITWAIRGDVLTKLTRHSEAVANYMRAAELDPDNAESWHRLAIACSKSRNFDGAKEAVERFIQLAPDDERVSPARSMVEQLERYSSPTPSSTEEQRRKVPVHVERAADKLQQQLRQVQASARRSSTRSMRAPGAPKRTTSRKMKAVQVEVQVQAEKVATPTEQETPDNVAPNLASKSESLVSERRSQAPAPLSNPPEPVPVPEPEPALPGLPEAQALFALSRNIEALRIVERLVTESAKDVAAWILRARILLALDKADAAGKSLEQATLHDGKNVEAWKLTARVCMAQKKTDRSLDAVERAYGITPSDPEVHRLRGDCLVASNRHLEAIYAYEKAVHYAPKDVDAWLSLGRVLRLVKRPAPAKEALEKACGLADTANRPDVATEARDLLSRLG